MRKILILQLALIASGCGAQATRRGEPVSSVAPAAQRGELLPDEQVQHVLNRLAFGPRPGDVERVRALGVDQWIDLQLHSERIPDPRADSVAARYAVFGMPTADIIEQYGILQQFQRQAKAADAADSTMGRADARRAAAAQDPKIADVARRAQQFVGQIQSAQLARAVGSDRQLQEVMTEFWENHFSVFAGKGQTRLFLAQYDRDVIRPNALGKFRDLLGAVAKSAAMLFYLDNALSAADSNQTTLAQLNGRGARPAARRVLQQAQARGRRGLNENYARELMELHTLGVDGGYSQKDVQEVARALTGWGFNRRTGEFAFTPLVHDAGAKTILGHRFPAGRGVEEGEEVLDIVARHPSTARFITTKLARHFVSDDPPAALVDRCAAAFTKTDGDVRETLRCIVTSPEFFSRAAYRAKVKTPFELVASALRAVNAQPDPTPRSAQVVARMGQPIFGRQTPDGWPDRADAWMNTGAILNRINFGLSVAAGQLPGARPQNVPELVALRDQPRAAQVDGVVKAILGGQVSSVTREVLMSGENPMLRPPSRDSTAAMVSAGPVLRPINLKGLPQVVGLALGAPEFQRR